MNSSTATQVDASRALEAAESIAASVVSPLASKWDAEGRFPSELFAALREPGLDAMAVPRDLGGWEIGPDTDDPLTFWKVIRTLASADSSSAHCVQGHTHSVHAVRTFGNSDQRKKFLGPVVGEGAVFGFWGSEQSGRPTAGGPPATKATRVAGGWELSGRKYYSTNGRAARFGVVFAVPSDSSDPVKDMMMCVVDCTADGFQVNPAWWESATGMRSTVSDELILDRVFVPDDAILGAGGDYWSKQVQSKYLSSFASNFHGVAQHLLTYGEAYLGERGRLTSAAVQQKFGQAQADVAAIDALLHQTAEVHRRGTLGEAAQQSRMLRSASEQATRRVIELVQESCGASVYFREHPFERILRDWSFFSRHENVELIQQAIGAFSFGLSEGSRPEDSGFHASGIGLAPKPAP